MGFKEDADFARFVSMGAIGTAAVGRYLRDVHGHRPIELERYAMANKVWQTKVKRLRLPDLLCTRCGRRVESRAKSKLGIIVSHSERPGREWNAGGMRPEDFYAFARADLGGDAPTVGRPVFFTSSALNEAIGRAKLSDPKSASEGSEVTMSWPSWVASRSGVVRKVDDQDRIVCDWDNGGTLSYWQWRKWGEPKYLYVSPGEHVIAGETLIAGTVALANNIDCTGDTWDVEAALHSDDTTERYAAVKTIGVDGRTELAAVLARMADSEEDWRMRLEVLVSLARMEPETWTAGIIAVAEATETPNEARMEAVFALCELPTDSASSVLAAVAEDVGNPPEVRSAAAWGLGRGVHPRVDLLLPLTVAADPLVSLHAIVGLEVLPNDLVPELLSWFESGDDRRAAAAAHIMSRHHVIGPLLKAAQSDGDARLWALNALGDLSPDLVREAAGGDLDAETERALGPMWMGQRDWLRRDEGRDGLEALDVQTVRFDPVDLSD